MGLSHGRPEKPILHVPPAHEGTERRILVVANETVGGEPLLNELRRRSEGVREHVLVVVPALNSPLKHWVSDDDGAREAARSACGSLETMRAAGIEAAAKSATAIRCRRSRMPCVPLRPTS